MRPLAVILLPLLVQLAIGAALSSTAACPEQEDIHPCSCSVSGINLKITCDGVSVTDIQEALNRSRKFLQEQNVYEIRLIGVKAERLPSLLFSGLRMAQLTILDCDLQGLADSDCASAFAGVRGLKQLYILNSIKGDNELTTLRLEHLESLRELWIWKSNIPGIRNDFFRNGPYNLQKLGINDCGVRTIGDRAFATLTNLTYLGLQNNLFQKFPRSLFPIPAASLKTLDLGYGNLSILPEDTFAEMPSLTYVTLQRNPIRRLPGATWSSVWSQLKGIDLEGNPIECDSHIEWIFKMKKPLDIFGKCASLTGTLGFRGKELSDLISENQKSTF